MVKAEGSPVKESEAPRKSLRGLDAEAAASVIAAAADVALIVDGDGVIRDLAFGSEELSLEGYGKWLGQPWAETVTVESRPKVEALLRDARLQDSRGKWRHVNHPSSRGADVPVLYSAIQVGKEGRVVAVGRDLRAISALQQRLVDAQQSMERDYWRLRHVETRYRLLFQMASEAVLIVDASTQKVVEANPAASELLGETAKRMVGRAFPEGFDADEHAGHPGPARGRPRGRSSRRRACAARPMASASFSSRRRCSARKIPRCSWSACLPPHAETGERRSWPKTKSAMLKVVESAPDGFVVTDQQGAS